MSARGIIRSTLARYGLESLADWAWKKHQAGSSIEEILLEMRKRPEYKARFPAMDELAKGGRAISEEEYMNYESSVRQLLSQNGLPMGVYGTSDYIAELLVNDVSLAEAQSRMQIAQAASLTAPDEYRREAARLFGVKPGEWASIWLETERTLPELERLYASSVIAGEVTIADLGQLSKEMSQRLADAGVDASNVREGLSTVSRQLGVSLPGEAEAGLGTDTLVGGALGEAEESRRLLRLRRQRIAQFAGGGSAVTTQEGATGLGTSGQ